MLLDAAPPGIPKQRALLMCLFLLEFRILSKGAQLGLSRLVLPNKTALLTTFAACFKLAILLTESLRAESPMYQ
ncbi:hypothetical protein C8R48DRAFT_728151 [Suillus tomentosus]|nr:hypothetical protein C8R48DRAFT_728151 [Suillus tomentosus]